MTTENKLKVTKFVIEDEIQKILDYAKSRINNINSSRESLEAANRLVDSFPDFIQKNVIYCFDNSVVLDITLQEKQRMSEVAPLIEALEDAGWRLTGSYDASYISPSRNFYFAKDPLKLTISVNLGDSRFCRIDRQTKTITKTVDEVISSTIICDDGPATKKEEV